MTETGIESRLAAHRVLTDVLERRRPLDDVLAGNADIRRLASRDRAFARLLVATALRRLGQIDAAILSFLERPLPPANADALMALRLGAAQLLFLGTPAHAAVSTTVEIVHHDPRRRGLVNAVLRRIAAQAESLLAGQDAARMNTPDWLWRSWTAAYGEDRTRAIAEAHLIEAPLDLTVKAAPDDWARRLEAEILPCGSLRRPAGGAVESLPGFEDGAWWVQDAAAALPARLVGDVRGRRVIDLCAAPGGKTAQLAALGARVIAVDRSGPRLERLRQNLARLKLVADTVADDATAWAPPEPADAVLLDAPCTATGTIRRHPDIPHLKTAADQDKLAALQDRLLARAVTMLKPGGTLVYCTCSLQPAEGEARIAEFLAGGAPLARAPIAAAELGIPAACITAAGEVRTTPAEGFDGFYIGRFRRS